MNNKYILAIQRMRQLKRRRNLKRVLLSVIGLLLLLSIFTFTTIYSKSERSTKTITVYCGDSFWSIANEYHYKGDIRKFEYEVRNMNNLNTSILQPGDRLEIPLY